MEALSTTYSRAELMLNVGIQVQKMALSQSELQGEAIQKLFASTEIILDPDLGRHIDTFA